MVALPDVEKSLWREASSGQLYPSLKGEVYVDVAVIGAGITGLTAAYLLKQHDYTVAVIDKDTIGAGTTGRTTGKVTSQHNLAYTQLQKSVGKYDTQVYAEANQAAIDLIEKIIKTEHIDCDWERADNYVYTDKSSQLKKFQEEARIAAKFGLPAQFVTKTPLPFPIKGAVKFSRQGKMSAQKYVLGLAEAIHGDKSFVFEHTTSGRIHDGEPCVVFTENGKIIAKHIIVATNVPTMPLIARGAYCFLEYPTESYLIAAPWDGDLPGMYISPDKRHYSILPVKFQGKKYLLIGGGGHVSGLRFSKWLRFRRLAKYAQKHFGITEISHKWSDRDYIAYDKLPIAGPMYPWSHHLYVGTGFKKWGLTNGTVAALVVATLITGQPNKWAKTFRPQRLRPLKYIPRAIFEEARNLW